MSSEVFLGGGYRGKSVKGGREGERGRFGAVVVLPGSFLVAVRQRGCRACVRYG